VIKDPSTRKMKIAPHQPFTIQKQRVSKSKYEMNLAEFPLAFLATRIPKNTETLEYQDTITGKDGLEIPRHWKIYPHSKLGFPTPSTQATLFELFQIWACNDFESPIINFGSIYELIKLRGLAQYDKKTYERIRRDLNILVGITIEAKNAFWDNEKGAYVDKTFHLFEEVNFYHKGTHSYQQPLPFAHIKASETLYGSIEASGLITLKHVDSKFFYKLTPIEQRLALYLGKMLYKAIEHRRDVMKIAQQLPVLAKSRRHVKEQLTKACNSLITKNFPYLAGYYYEKGVNKKTENIRFFKKPSQKNQQKQEPETTTKPLFRLSPPKQQAKKDTSTQALLVQDILDVTHDYKSRDYYQIVAQKMSDQVIYRALSEVKAEDIPSGTVRNRGALFTNLIERYASEQGITLNPKRKR